MFFLEIDFDNIKHSNTDKCPRFSFHNKSHDYSDSTCKPRVPTQQDCLEAYKKYGKGPFDSECPKPSSYVSFTNICKFTEYSKRTSSVTKMKVKCNFHLCEGSLVRVGVLQPTYGLMIQPEYWYTARNDATLEYILDKILKENIGKGLDFCVLTCTTKSKKTVKQLFVFPPYIKQVKKLTKSNRNRKMNVNVVVLDSVSRQHFYRHLKRSVTALEELHKTNTVDILDFELFQSIAPRTFPNMRALFSGIVDADSDDEKHTYGLDSLFGRFHNLGYQTLLQEDSCWFDPWGALITDNKHNLQILQTPEQYGERWRDLQRKLHNLPIDSYGLTHFSCEVFLQYGRTNQFNNPPKVCYNGHHLSDYFLNHTYKFIKSIESMLKSYPGFSYTHLNTGHEVSGKRIAYIDFLIANFLNKVSRLQNTLTILLSDHGPKTTKFSQEFLMGRYEIGHPFMFMILPNQVRHQLGKTRFNALNINQYRLISHTDLFHTLMSLSSNKSLGLLAAIPGDRDCQDIPLYSFMSCLCEGSSEVMIDSNSKIHWLAEYAVGYLNNLIRRSLGIFLGYGNCERLIGKRFDKIRKKTNDVGDTIYTFDLIVHRYRGEEVFEVAFCIPKLKTLGKGSVSLLRWRRVTIFQHYAKCCDKNVEVELCICRKESSNIINPARDNARLLSIPTFNIVTKAKFVDSKCLALLLRHRPNVFINYELTNLCSDRKYNVTFSISSEKEFQSTFTEPQTILVRPWRIYYLGTVELDENLSQEELTETITNQLIP